MTDWSEVRKYFPVLENYTYLNSAGGCALPTQAAEAGKRFYDEMHQLGDVHWPAWLEQVEVVRMQVAKVIGAEPDEIALLSNASLAMNYARALLNTSGSVLFAKGDFPSVSYPWLLAENSPIFVEPKADGVIEISDLEEALQSDTACLAVGHVQYGSGFRFNLEALAEFTRSHSLSFVVDATQSFGAFPLNVRTCRPDVLLFSGYKWCCAGYGIAVMYVRRELLKKERIPFAGWRSAESFDLMDSSKVELSSSARVLELGHPPFAGIFALGGALSLFSQIGIENIQKRVLSLEQYLREGLSTLGVEVRSPSDPRYRSGIVMVQMKNAAEIVQRLKEEKVFVSFRAGMMRVSVHFYNNESDIEKFLLVLKHLMA